MIKMTEYLLLLAAIFIVTLAGRGTFDFCRWAVVAIRKKIKARKQKKAFNCTVTLNVGRLPGWPINDVNKTCYNCKYLNVYHTQKPCCDCGDKKHWTKIKKKKGGK